MLFTASYPAQAGFEWTPPPAVIKPPPSQQSAPPNLAFPVPPVYQVNDDILLPEEAEMPVIPSIPDVSQQFLPDHSTLQKIQTSPALPVIDSSYKTVVGFGQDIPLVLALRQIVPAHYSYSFATGLNPGMLVSWTGGKSWDRVLNEMLSSFNMHAIIFEKSVSIRMGSPALSSPSSMPTPPILEEKDTPPMLPIENADLMDMQSPRAIHPDAHSDDLPLIITKKADDDDIAVPSYPRRIPPSAIHNIPSSKRDMSQEPPVRRIIVEKSTHHQENQAVTPSMPLPSFPEAATKTAPASLHDNVFNAISSTESSMPEISSTNMQSASAMDPFEIKFWHAEKGNSLQGILEDWAASANVSILWHSSYDYKLSVPIRMHGTFPDAVTHILTSYDQEQTRPLGRLHPNLPNGPSVLVIEDYTPNF